MDLHYGPKRKKEAEDDTDNDELVCRAARWIQPSSRAITVARKCGEKLMRIAVS